MRPLRLDLEGFGTFREPATVDLSDTDFFALVGPTGSGKTTIIDGICFALYGSVPRWPRVGQVSLALAPSVTAGRVSLIFDVGGRRLAVVRALQRSKSGAVGTKEARLDRLPAAAEVTGELAAVLDAATETLAAGEGVTAAVEAELGLSWKHFTQCVVLPQGDFAKFLHASPSDRQELLVSLLGLDMYDKVRRAAGERAKKARWTADRAAGQVERYADATAEAEADAEARLRTLAGAAGALPARLRELTAAETALQARVAERDERRARLGVLAAVSRPAGLDDLVERGRRAERAVADAEAAVASAEKAELDRTAEAEQAGDPAVWQAVVGAHEQAAALDGRIATGAGKVAELAEAVAAAGRELEAAEAGLAEAQAALEHAGRDHSAAALAATLVTGEPCPVCRRPVDAVPEPHVPADLARCRRRVTEAEARTKQARTRLAAADTEHARAEALLTSLREQRQRQDAVLAEHPDPAAAAGAAVTAEQARADLAAARKATQAARAAVRQARNGLDGLAEQTRQARHALAAARDPLVAFGAPAVTGGGTAEELAADWAALTTWAAERHAAETAHLPELEAQLTAAAGQRADQVVVLGRLLAEAGVVLPDDQAGPDRVAELATAAVAAAQADAQAALDRVRERREQAAALAAERSAAEEQSRVAGALGTLLDARHFERWLCDEALTLLVVDASATLAQLSGGQYELVYDGGDIAVVDHNDAGSRRPVRTLSGGETFQAALALALALSQQVATLSAAGSRGLDTILLDEGFGTLDASTLDTVAATLEQLAGGGERTVGIVTHVPQLAERVPVQFRVTRQGGTSQVEKVTL
jgi:DNA repair protein SbcC/Rad50